ncbi:MAG: UDP-N-acetylmuramoyl-L-alanyl-D-glutamate--2,6-diaminopimelate ligase [Planctomycetota bacterium]
MLNPLTPLRLGAPAASSDLRNLLAGIDAAVVAAPGNLRVAGITEDSRRVKPGWLFAAIRGKNVDGRAYIDDAIRRGATTILSNRRERVPDHVSQVIAADLRTTLGRLCARFHNEPANRLNVVGITGTNGKTTTTFLLQHVLNMAGHKSGRLGTVDNDFGDGKTTAAEYTTMTAEHLHGSFDRMVRNGCSHAAIEVSSQALDQQRTAGMSFAAALFTNLTQDHLDYHGSIEHYANCKAKLFGQVRVSGFAALNGDDPFAPLMVGSSWCGVRTYGFGRHNAYRVKHVEGDATGSSFRISHPGGHILVRTPLVGQYNVANVLGVFALAHGLGIDPGAIAEGLQTATGAPGRLERVAADGSDLAVFVDYAHTPDALEKALLALRAVGPDRPLIVVFGCGGDRDRTKRPLMGQIASRLADAVTITSDNPRTEDPEAIVRDVLAGVPQMERHRTLCLLDRADAIEQALAGAPAGSTVLIAGKGHEDYQIVGKTKHHFDDREVARDVLAHLAVSRVSWRTRRAG